MRFRSIARSALACAAALVLSACMTLEYDLSTVQIPIDAKPSAAPGAVVDSVIIEDKHVMYLHGLLGEYQPDVAEIVSQYSQGYSGVADLRVTHSAQWHDWLLTHFTLTLLRFRTVRVEMQRIR